LEAFLTAHVTDVLQNERRIIEEICQAMKPTGTSKHVVVTVSHVTYIVATISLYLAFVASGISLTQTVAERMH
jgi:hypothetical protein